MIKINYWKTACLFLLVISLSRVSHSREYKHGKNDSLINEIEKMLIADQKYRWMITYGELDEAKIEKFKRMEMSLQMKRKTDVLNNRAGISQFQKDSLFVLQRQIDSINFIKIRDVIKATGIPSYIRADKIAVMLQHAPIELVDASFFTLLMSEVKENRLPALEYANLYDNVQLQRKKDELYYVIEHYDASKGVSTPHMPKDLARTNEERKKIGLKKLNPGKDQSRCFSR